MNEFSLDLLRPNLGATKPNVVLSPWNVAVALAMTRLGARGTTADEMDRVLQDAQNDPPPQASEIEAANRVFVQQDLHLQGAFTDGLTSTFGATIGLADFKTAAEAARQVINDWVAGETHRRITELVPPGAIHELTRLVLVSAVYLKADWAMPFPKALTRPGTFHGPDGDVEAMFMHDNNKLVVTDGDHWQAVDLPYVGGQLSMTIVVPDQDRFDDVVARLDPMLLDEATQGGLAQLDLALPKFDLDTHIRVKHQLIALGMPTAFSDHADFTGITDDEPLCIDDVIHQANLTVDEQGTVAAAATAVLITAVSAVPRRRHLVVDRPFLFFLRDRATGLVLFAGQVTDPSRPETPLPAP